MIIKKNEAIKRLATYNYILANPKLKMDWIDMAEDHLLSSKKIISYRRVLFFVFRFLQGELETEPNLFLQYELAKYLQKQINVEGKELARLYVCNCCGYYSLLRKNEYDICKVCFWENDGITDEQKYSHSNKMTLGEAIQNFKKYGAVSLSSLHFLHKERFNIYKSSN